MVQIIPTLPGAGARFGQGISKGLSDIIPKETERRRLASGLEQLNQEQGLTPQQYFTKAVGVPGIAQNPQLLQSLEHLARQQNTNNALKNKAEEQASNPFERYLKPPEEKGTGGIPSLTKREELEATLNPTLPPTQEDVYKEAGRILKENPALAGNDPNKALALAEAKYNKEVALNQAKQDKRKNQIEVSNRLKQGLKDQRFARGTTIPENVYQKIENKAINAVDKKGMTEDEAAKKYGQMLDKVDRQYSALDAVGNWSVPTRSAEENKRSIRNIRKDFKERDDLENFADRLTGTNGFSPAASYYMAYDPSDIPELKATLRGIPSLQGKETLAETIYPEDRESKTEHISEILAPFLKHSEASPLAISQVLEAKGYDPNIWMNYVGSHREELKLSERQGRELGKPRNTIRPFNDLWLFSFSGKDELLE